MKEQTAAPTVVEDVLETPGQPLPHSAYSSFGRRFGSVDPSLDGAGDDGGGSRPWDSYLRGSEDRFERRADAAAARALREPDEIGASAVGSPKPDFRSVRIHADAPAAESASALSADAYTVGHHIVFGAGRFDSATPAGRGLLAHELAHVVQQDAGAFDGPAIQRRRTGRNFGILLGLIEGEFSDRELNGYLSRVERRGAPEGEYISDNMARAIVRRWMAADPSFELTPRQKVLLIDEMLDGPTLRKDEEGILDLLENSSNAALRIMFSGSLDVDELRRNIDFKKRTKRLENFFATRFEGGASAVFQGEVKVIGGPGPAAPKFAYQWQALRKRVDGPYTADEVVAEIKALTTDEKEQATTDLAKYRVEASNELRDIGDQGLPEAYIRTKSKAVLKIDEILRVLYLDITLSESSLEPNQALKDIEEAEKPAIKEALRPSSKSGASGDLAETDKPAFKQELTDFLTGKIKADYDSLVVGKGETEHGDPTKVHGLERFVEIAEAATFETDSVFGRYKVGPPVKTPTDSDSHPGLIADQWAKIQANLTNRKFDKDDRRDSARGMIMYYLQMGEEAFAIYRKFDAMPEFDPDDTPQNKAARALIEIADEFTDTEDKVGLLNAIERGWPGSHAEGVVFIQIFKQNSTIEDRTYFWVNFQILIHEYLHALVDEDRYRTHAKSFGESSLQYNTLIEGVASLLTEIVWANVRPRVQDASLRKQVEGPSYAALPFDETTVWPITKIRYPSYNQAAQLVALVGVRNLYDAYFRGNIERIGA